MTMTNTLRIQYRETRGGIETCGCFAPGCKRGSHGARCERPAGIEVITPFDGEMDVCRNCFDTHFIAWAFS